MGARLYNPTTGQFTSLDPVVGGNENNYNYPNDPINKYDLDGRLEFNRPDWMNWRNAARAATVIGFGVCVVASAGACLAAGLVGAVISARADAREWGGDTFRRSLLRNGAYALAGAGVGRALGSFYRSAGKSGISRAAYYSRTTLRYRFGRRVSDGRRRFGWRRVAKWNYHSSFYGANAKIGVTG